ncbi:type II secretion system F family protein [Siccirubricoccus deserti]
MTGALAGWAVGIFGTLFAAATFWLIRQARRDRLYNSRTAMIRLSMDRDASRGTSTQPNNGLVSIAIWLGTVILRSGLLSKSTQSVLHDMLRSAGAHGGSGMALFVGAKVMGFVALPALALVFSEGLDLSPTTQNLLIGGSGVIGLMAPEWILKKIRNNHVQRVRSGLPDTLDMLVICADAGLGLEPALARVKDEIRFAHPAISKELGHTVSELRMMSEIRTALTNLGSRTGVEGLKRLAATLIQAAQYGTPLTTALRELAAELRQEMTTEFEARAARLPVKLTVPLIIFILPCIILVMAGPAVVKVMKDL